MNIESCQPEGGYFPEGFKSGENSLSRVDNWMFISYGVNNCFIILKLYIVDRCLSLCPFSVGHSVVCSSSFTASDYPFGIFKLF